MPGKRDIALDAETIRELMDWTVSFSEDDMIGIKTSRTFRKNNKGAGLARSDSKKNQSNVCVSSEVFNGLNDTDGHDLL